MSAPNIDRSAGPRVLVPLAHGCEELEAVTIIDLLRRAGVTVVSAGLDDEPVVASRGVRLLPDTRLEDLTDTDFDMMVLPGGLKGSENLEKDPRIRSRLTSMQQTHKFTGAICAAPRVLASAGLLEGKKATGYPGVLDAMQLANTELSNDAVVVDGRVVTSRGPGTAMDFGLQLIELLVGRKKRDEVEEGLVR